ncbi:MAG: GNAT family N-acetyltransferase [Flavobacteriaceae bacterium]|nr:GNAT family N-acetyltransferase [Flavobacteriaceae bacterium]|tara:strand:+ start:1528 stop:2001 length:474 start_codon:yes stop_codon:yes gene_type:complete
MTEEIYFRPYISNDATDFKVLNIEWLEAYFEVEPYDELILDNPKREILDNGGSIFMMLKEGKTIGTFAFLNKEDGLYEFSKMAVIPKERGKGYGNLIMQFAIRHAEKNYWKSLILYSNTILENSIHLYKKYGFLEVPIDPGINYSRGNIKMELKLNS